MTAIRHRPASLDRVPTDPEIGWPFLLPPHMKPAMGPTGWYEFKLFLERTSAVSMDALHVIAGLLVFLLASVLLKKGFASALPWLAVLALELCNEAFDLHAEQWPNRTMQFGEGAKDILLTMALPTLLMVVSRLSRAPDGGSVEGPHRSASSAEIE